MIYVSRRDGSTSSYDLLDLRDRREFVVSSRLSDPVDVSAVSLGCDHARADLPVPRRFRVLSYDVRLELDRRGEPVAEVVTAVCRDLMVSLTMYLNGRSGRFRVDVDRR